MHCWACRIKYAFRPICIMDTHEVWLDPLMPSFQSADHRIRQVTAVGAAATEPKSTDQASSWTMISVPTSSVKQPNTSSESNIIKHTFMKLFKHTCLWCSDFALYAYTKRCFSCLAKVGSSPQLSLPWAAWKPPTLGELIPTKIFHGWNSSFQALRNMEQSCSKCDHMIILILAF